MKKAQFASPIILILLIVSYFIITAELSRIQSALIQSKTLLLKISNDIKEIEEMDLEWQANITSEALMLLSSNNSSGTINSILNSNNAIISFQRSPLMLNYTKTYSVKGFSKTINGTILVPYPYNEFTQAEERIRNSCSTITQECTDSSINNELIIAELIGSSIYLSHTNYPLSFSYDYIILTE